MITFSVAGGRAFGNVVHVARHSMYASVSHQGPVPERRNNSIPGINVPYFRDNFIPGINSVPKRRNSAIQGINLG